MYLASVVFFLQILPSSSIANALGLDPVENYCARFEHQSAVKNDTLYIYGGGETFIDVQDYGRANGTVTVGYNEFMISVDLSSSWDWYENISETLMDIKSTPNTVTLPPQVVRGALYQGTSRDSSIYLYGGTTSYANTSFPGWQPPLGSTYSLWSYDVVALSWAQHDVATHAPYRPNGGAATEAPDQGLAFYLNGQIDGGSSTSPDDGLGNVVLLDGMVVINTTDQSARNFSTTGLNNVRRRTRGRMQYVPGIGEKGVLVVLGGISTGAQLNSSRNSDLILMSEVDVFDVSSLYHTTTSTPDGDWYKQNATGQNGTAVPNPRVDFCLTTASAHDSSSHNIYMYGGRDAANHYFDDLWILSLPSFTWTLLYSGASPRFAHTCHLVSNRTMLTVGGVASATQMQGMGDTDLSACDWEIKGVGVLDLSSITWGSLYDAKAPAYEVPLQVISTIGGSPTGNALMKAPASGFSDDGLARLFAADVHGNTTNANESTTNSNGNITNNQPQSSSISGPKKIKIIVGSTCGVATLAILGGIGWYFQYRSQKKRANCAAHIPKEPIEKDGIELARLTRPANIAPTSKD